MSRITELTPIDTGEVLEPHPWTKHPDRSDYGRVDFDEPDGQSIATIRVVPNGGRYTVEVICIGTETENVDLVVTQ